MKSASIPIVRFSYDFTASSPTPVKMAYEAADPVPFMHIPKSWAIQVTGYDVNGAQASPTSWDVLLEGSLDGVAFNEGSVILEHANTTKAIGDTIYNLGNVYPTNYIALKCKALVLGATCMKIVVNVLGVF